MASWPARKWRKVLTSGEAAFSAMTSAWLCHSTQSSQPATEGRAGQRGWVVTAASAVGLLGPPAAALGSQALGAAAAALTAGARSAGYSWR